VRIRTGAILALCGIALGCPGRPKAVVYDLAARAAVAETWSGADVLRFGTPAAEPRLPYRFTPQGTVVFEEQVEFLPPPPDWSLVRVAVEGQAIGSGEFQFAFLHMDPGPPPSQSIFAYDEDPFGYSQDLALRPGQRQCAFIDPGAPRMTERRARLLPYFSLLVLWTVWGSTYLAIRVVVHEMPPFAAASVRFAAAGLVMGVIALIVDRANGWPDRRQWRDYSLVGVLLLAVGNGLVMSAERSIPSGIAALIVATVPLWLLVLDGLRPGGQPWTLRVWIGTLIGLAGVVFVARPSGEVAAGHWPGVIALQVAALTWTVGSLYAQSVKKRLPLFTAAAIEMIAGSAVLFLESKVMGEDLGLLGAASPRAWLALLYLAVFGSLVGFTAYAYCLNELPASTVGTYAYVNPVVAVTLGSLLLGERLSPGLLVGGALIVVAVLLSTLRARKALPAAPAREAEA
jgi:drug/metabolite transporter (DMT)-like permease